MSLTTSFFQFGIGVNIMVKALSKVELKKVSRRKQGKGAPGNPNK
jgi:hypothetical protein